MLIGRVIKTFIEEGTRIIQALFLGSNDVREVDEIAQFGIDSSPVKDMVAIYSETSVNGDSVIIGYINPNQLAKPGETRLFSLDSSGNLANYVWLKNNGDIEIGGNTDNFVKHTSLDTALQAYKNLVNSELLKIQTAITSLGGAYPYVATSININSAKTQKIKTQ